MIARSPVARRSLQNTRSDRSRVQVRRFSLSYEKHLTQPSLDYPNSLACIAYIYIYIRYFVFRHTIYLFGWKLALPHHPSTLVTVACRSLTIHDKAPLTFAPFNAAHGDGVCDVDLTAPRVLEIARARPVPGWICLSCDGFWTLCPCALPDALWRGSGRASGRRARWVFGLVLTGAVSNGYNK